MKISERAFSFFFPVEFRRRECTCWGKIGTPARLGSHNRYYILLYWKEGRGLEAKEAVRKGWTRRVTPDTSREI